MPVARPVRQRAVTDENAENGTTTRMTRAKAAGIETTVDPDMTKLKKPTATTKRSQSALSTLSNPQQPTQQTRKRAALGDVSNVNNDGPAPSKDAKKMGAVATKTSTTTTTTKPTASKVAKPVRSSSTRSALGAKDGNATAAPTRELKRSASGMGQTGNPSKKRNTSGSSQTLSQTLDEQSQGEEDEVVAVKKAKPSAGKVKVEIEVKKTVVSTIVPPPPAPEVDDEPYTESVHSTPDNKEEDEAQYVHQLNAELAKDLDTEDLEDPLMVAEYVHEIFDYLLQLEPQTMANPNYMDKQPELEWNMRGILVDWLLEVHSRFRLLPETLFVCVNIIDRFLSRKVVKIDTLQLVGVTALFIASKYEEVLSPHVQNFRHVADDGFSEEEILSAERFVLAALDYDLSYPNPMNFLRRISKADQYDISSRTLAKYLVEISCLDHRFIAYPGSQIAAAAMYTSRMILSRGEWDPTIAHYSGYTEDEIQPVFKLILDYLTGPLQHEAFYKKYASKKFMKASIVARQWAKNYVTKNDTSRR